MRLATRGSTGVLLLLLSHIELPGVMFLREDNNNYKQDGGTQSVFLHVGEYKSRAHIREIQTLS